MLARLTGEDKATAKLKLLQARVDFFEKRAVYFTVECSKIELIIEQQARMQKAIIELNAITNILLSVQQQIIEDIVYSPAGTSTKKGSGVMILPLVTDDDDLPN